MQFYFNDAPLGSGPEVTSALYDIGQVEVLKGPQGTLRGRSSPGGAITITTKRPDLDETGGFIDLSGTHRGNMVFKGAIGTPIIEDVLALRVAGILDHSDGSGVTSVNNGIEPYSKTESVRASLLFSPTENFSANLMAQKLWTKSRSFDQVIGPGAGYNGPPLDPSDRKGITDGPRRGENKNFMLVGNADWSFGGQKLSYVGSYSEGRGSSISTQDTANAVPGVEYYQYVDIGIGDSYSLSHELRLSSEERVFDMFDYVVGLYYDKSKNQSVVDAPARFLTGAFGPPGNSQQLIDPVDRYTLRTAIDLGGKTEEKSIFANVTAHLGDNTELSVGGRYINYEREDEFTLALQPGFFAAFNSPVCFGAFVPSTVYPGVCDAVIAGNTLQDVSEKQKFKPFVYNVALSHDFSDDFLVYGNIGSAFRSAGPRIGFTSLLTCCVAQGGTDNLGSIEDLVFQDDERSTAYELGFKATFLDKRARLNVAVFKQDFDNYYFVTKPVRYIGVSDPLDPASSNVSSSEFTTGADASVKGFDIEAGMAFTDNFWLNLGFSWSKGNLKDAIIPCNDGNFDGTPDDIVPTAQDFVDNGVLVARCASDETIARTSRWNLTAQSEYSHALTDGVDGFIRGNLVYYPDNPNASDAREIDKYALVNLYLGLRDPSSNWELTAFANNLLNEQQILSYNSVQQTSAGGAEAFFGRPASGYNAVSMTPRREFGLQLRYSFGSR